MSETPTLREFITTHRNTVILFYLAHDGNIVCEVPPVEKNCMEVSIFKDEISVNVFFSTAKQDLVLVNSVVIKCKYYPESWYLSLDPMEVKEGEYVYLKSLLC